MITRTLLKSPLAGVLALAVLGSAHARPVSMFEPDDDLATFSSASEARVVHNPHAVVSKRPSDDDDAPKFHDPKFHDKREHRVEPVSAIPEPSTYALLAAGLVGIAIVTRRRRPSSDR